MLATLLAVAATAGPQPGTLKTFQDWTVGCDNIRSCQAVALMPERGHEGFVTARVERWGQADAVPVIGISERDVKAASLGVPGQSARIGLTSNGQETLVPRQSVASVVALTRTGNSAILYDAAGKRVGTISLRGASAALRYMDEQQGRAGTVTALIARGEKSAAAVPMPPRQPIVNAAPVATRAAPFKVSAAQEKQLRSRSGCQIEDELGPNSVQSDAVDSRHVLILLSCGAGAYNYNSVAFIATGRGRRAQFAPARFDVAEPVLVNAGWDGETRLLGSFSKGRGLADCGVGQEFAWDGARFRLVHQYELSECRGSTDYITTWRAEVVR